MSLNRKFKKYGLQHKEKNSTASGSSKEKWVNNGEIEAAVYKQSESRESGTEVYNKSTHIGLTRLKGLKANVYRLVDSDDIYNVVSVVPGRLDTLLLEVVSDNV